MTYDELVKKVKTASGRTDATTINAIPDFISAAESYLDSRLRIQGMIKSESFDSTGTHFIPVDLVQIDEVIINGVSGWLMSLPTVLEARKTQNPNAQENSAEWYAMNAGVVEIVAPAQVELFGYAKAERLSKSIQESVYSRDAPNALYWLALSYLSTFARDNEGASAWMALANDEINNLNTAHQNSRYVGEASRAPAKPERYF